MTKKEIAALACDELEKLYPDVKCSLEFTEAEVTTTTTASTETTTTTSNETTVTATEAANSDPGTGDSGVAIPIVFLSLAAGTALVMRKKSD